MPRKVASCPGGVHCKCWQIRNMSVCACQVFNGGSDFNEPVKRCLDRLHTAAWANSDILLVSDGELRQPGSEIMRKLAGGNSPLLYLHIMHLFPSAHLSAEMCMWKQLCSFAKGQQVLS